MAEEKQKAKRLILTRKILRWILLVLLTLLIIVGVIFQAPWKVTTLLIIFLLACTVLPKSARKWFWLTVGVVVVALIIWVFLPEDNKDWQPYKFTFDDEITALEARYEIPDEENAAIIYNQLLENYDANAIEPNFIDANYYDSTLSEPWSDKDYPEIAHWLQQKQETIEKLLEAAKIEKCLFPIVADSIGLGQHMEILRPMRHWAFLLIRAANNDLGEGRETKALEKYRTVMRIGQHLCQQPTMIDYLVGIAIESVGRSCIKKFIVEGEPKEEHLKILEDAFVSNNYNWKDYFLRILEYEKFVIKDQFSNNYEINSKGKIRISRDPLSRLRTIIRKQIEEKKENNEFYMQLKTFAYPSYFQRKLTKASTIMRWFVMPSSPEKLSKIIDKHFIRFYAMSEADFDEQKESEEFSFEQLFSIRTRFNFDYVAKLLSNMSESSFFSFRQIYNRNFAEKRVCQIIIALRRYKNKNGQWPDSLDKIKDMTEAENFIDPINGSNFVYKLTEDGFTLYSKGENNIDDEGKRDSWEEETGKDDWLIWP